MKKKGITLIVIVASIILGIGVSRYFKLNTLSSLLIFKNDIYHSYYSEEVITKVIKDSIGVDYTGDRNKDFNNYIISLVLDDLRDEENIKWKAYNQYLDKDELNAIEQSRSEEEMNNQSYAIDEQLWYIRVDDFRKGTHSKLIENNLEEINSREKLILDLRNSSGGTVDEYLKFAEYFCEKGDLLLTVEGNGSDSFVSDRKQNIHVKEIYVFTSEKTASVSEQLAALIKHYKEGIILGENTFGKYIQASIRNLRDGGSYIFISGEMIPPSNERLLEGITPDFLIENVLELSKDELIEIVKEYKNNYIP